MANTTDKTDEGKETLGEYERHLKRDYSEDKTAHELAIVDFDAYEAMHQGKTYDTESKETTNGLTDSMTATIYLERAARVAGQLPEGEVEALGKKDKGKALFMDILRQKWIYPNANAQRSFKTKMFMWQYGSSEYGYMPMHYDLDVNPSGYFGPNCWLWNPRMFIPQSGFITIPDMEHVHALAYKGYQFFEDLKDEPDSAGWDKDTLAELDEQLKEATLNPDPKNDGAQTAAKGNTRRQILVATRYESGKNGHWVSFLPDYEYRVIRDIPNPHKNGKIPFVIKPCIPSFDSFYGVGDFQRSMPMQFANDGLDNFYFQGIKINLFPPTVANAQTMIRHTFSPEPGSVWEVNGNPNDVKRLETSTAGLATYQAAKGMSKGALQSIAGTTDTRANAENSMDPGMGKTPEALKMISAREGTRDNQDRELLEEAMTELIDGMMSLIPLISNKIPVDMFAQEIGDIVRAGHTDLEDIFSDAKKSGLMTMTKSQSGEQARLRIDPSKLSGLEYRFQLTPNSTAKKTKQEQLQALIDFLNFMGKMPNALQQYQEVSGKVPNWDKIFAQYGQLADIDGMDQFFTDQPAQGDTTGAGTGDTAQTQAAQPQGMPMRPPNVSVNYKDVNDPTAQNAILQEAIPGFQPQPQMPMQDPNAMPPQGMPPQAMPQQQPQFITPDMVMPQAAQAPIPPTGMHPVLAHTIQQYNQSRGM